MEDYMSDHKDRAFDDDYVQWEIVNGNKCLEFKVHEEIMSKIRENLKNGQIECKTALFNKPIKTYLLNVDDVTGKSNPFILLS